MHRYVSVCIYFRVAPVCVNSSVCIRLWGRLFSGVTPPNREALMPSKEGVDQKIIFRAVATPVPASLSHPIPSHPIPTRLPIMKDKKIHFFQTYPLFSNFSALFSNFFHTFSNFSKPFSNFFKLFQAVSNFFHIFFNFFQTFSNFSTFFQTFPHFFKFSTLFQPFPQLFKLF